MAAMHHPPCPAASPCLIQISDLHLPARPGKRLHGWDNWAAFHAVLAHARSHHPQVAAWLLTGDLVHDESPAGYRRLAAAMMALGAPVAAIPGNHDHPPTLAACMPGVRTSGRLALGGWALQLLDSHWPAHDAGRLGAAGLAALDQALARERAAHLLLAIHHPPAAVGSAWIDAIGLADGPALLDRAQADARVTALLCGHVHQASERTLAWSRAAGRTAPLRQLTAPAVTRQFLPQSHSPAVDAGQAPGYRCLTLGADGQLYSRIHRVPAARKAGAPAPGCG